MSGTPVTFAPTTRCPSSRVSVRIVPSPRSEKELSPCDPLDVLLVPVVTPVDPCSEGSCAIVLKMLGCAFKASCSAPITVVGVGAAKPLETMRDPVTTMSGAGPASSLCGGASGAIVAGPFSGAPGSACTGSLGAGLAGAGCTCAAAGTARAATISEASEAVANIRRRDGGKGSISVTGLPLLAFMIGRTLTAPRRRARGGSG